MLLFASSRQRTHVCAWCRLLTALMCQRGGSVSSSHSTRGMAREHIQMADTLAITQGLRELPRGSHMTRGPGSLWSTAGPMGHIDKPI